MHRDYSPGNILFDKIDGEYHFMLVDINRMSFGKISIDMGCANFARLWGQKAFFELLCQRVCTGTQLLMNNTALIKCLHTGRSSGFILPRNIK